jgi:hypothetical protein
MKSKKIFLLTGILLSAITVANANKLPTTFTTLPTGFKKTAGEFGAGTAGEYTKIEKSEHATGTVVNHVGGSSVLANATITARYAYTDNNGKPHTVTIGETLPRVRIKDSSWTSSGSASSVQPSSKGGIRAGASKGFSGEPIGTISKYSEFRCSEAGGCDIDDPDGDRDPDRDPNDR